MDIDILEKEYTAVPLRTYRWYVGVYSDYLETHVVHISRKEKYVIFDIFRRLRDEHTLNWSRNFLYEFPGEKTNAVRRLLLSKIRSTNRFVVLKACLYLLRNIRKSLVLDDYVLRYVPELKNFLDHYEEPRLTDLQRKIMHGSRGEHSLRDWEALLVNNRGFEKVLQYREEKYPGNEYHKTNLDAIELDLTTECNLKCYNCDRMCGRAESSERMTVDQVRKFLAESKSCGKQWERIGLSGGEPTLHPDIMEIVGLVLDYRNACLPKSSYVQVVSNGYGEAVDVLKKIESTYKQDIYPRTQITTFIRNNNKRNKVVLHSPVNMAPIDDPAFVHSDFRNGCWVTESSGLCLSRYGYFFCGAAAAIARVCGIDIGIKSLKEVCMSRIILQRKKLCPMCGRFNDLSISAEEYSSRWVVEEKSSVAWDRAFDAYRREKKVLALY